MRVTNTKPRTLCPEWEGGGSALCYRSLQFCFPKVFGMSQFGTVQQQTRQYSTYKGGSHERGGSTQLQTHERATASSVLSAASVGEGGRDGPATAGCEIGTASNEMRAK